MKQMCSQIRSCGLHGLDGIPVVIEVSILPGLPAFDIVGLGDSAVRESKDRVRAAICNSGFTFPKGRLIACYAPAWLRKGGSGFDLPLALAILSASGQVRMPDDAPVIIGELGLNGKVRHVPGIFCRALACVERKDEMIMVSRDDAQEAMSILPERTVPVASLDEAAHLVTHWERRERLIRYPFDRQGQNNHDFQNDKQRPGKITNRSICLSGQSKAVRALTLSAAGHHSLLMLGSPGCGKTSLASLLPLFLPPLTDDEAVEVTRIYSAAGLLPEGRGLIRERPFRAPHHATTRAALIGGGVTPVPGEVSLAHRGVLFLDELTEFKSDHLDLMRQPMELKKIHLSRLRYRMSYPADFLLIGAANPCPCGAYFEPSDNCRCSEEKIRDHLGRISGPLIDRIHLAVEMTRLSADDLVRSIPVCSSTSDMIDPDEVRKRILMCRQLQHQRCQEQRRPLCLNGDTEVRDLGRFIEIDENLLRYAGQAASRLQMSARSYHNSLRIARTIADLEQSVRVKQDHIDESFQYRIRWPGSRK